MKPGEIICREGDVILNMGRPTRTITVKNEGKLPIRVSSHYPFFEVNKDLLFDRPMAFGYRLNIPAGHSLLFAPGEEKTVELVEIAGNKQVRGFNGLTNSFRQQDDHGHAAQVGAKGNLPLKLDRKSYAAFYGPTSGDKIRLADSELYAEIEKDYTSYGDETLVGWGKNIRDGLMASSRVTRASAVDLIITNVVVMDPVVGIIKGNIGVKDGQIVGIGNAGNPDIKDNVDLIIDTNTALLPGEGLIATPGGIDTHVHLPTPELLGAAISSGITSIIGAGAGGVFGIGTNPEYMLHRMFEAFENVPLNLGLLGAGSASTPEPLLHNIYAGVCGLKIHEDVGCYPSVIDNCLTVADQMDVAVCLHTDSFNESCSVQDLKSIIGDRTVHAYHVEGTGGGHIPNLIEIVGHGNIISSSTNPTLPFTVNTVAEHKEMIIFIHKLNPAIKQDLIAAEARIKANTMAAENVLHDLGAISIVNSDSQGMGRMGETIRRTWQLADKMKKESPDPNNTGNDNERILRYLAKYTINPAVAHGINSFVGSLEPGKIADLVLWRPALFGVKPEFIIKKGFVVMAVVGDGNATTRNCQPLLYRPLFGSYGDAASSLCLNFVSRPSLDNQLARKLKTKRELAAVKNTRGIGPRNMIRNSLKPEVKMDLATGRVFVNGKEAVSPAAESVVMNRLYFLT